MNGGGVVDLIALVVGAGWGIRWLIRRRGPWTLGRAFYAAYAAFAGFVILGTVTLFFQGYWLVDMLLVAPIAIPKLVRRYYREPPFRSGPAFAGARFAAGGSVASSFSAGGSVNAGIAACDGMSGNQFETWVAATLRRQGYSLEQAHGGRGDRGADIVAVRGPERLVVQCKCYGGRVGHDAVNEANSARDIHRGTRAAVATNNYFTGHARGQAALTGVELWDRDYLADFCTSSPR